MSDFASQPFGIGTLPGPKGSLQRTLGTVATRCDRQGWTRGRFCAAFARRLAATACACCVPTALPAPRAALLAAAAAALILWLPPPPLPFLPRPRSRAAALLGAAGRLPADWRGRGPGLRFCVEAAVWIRHNWWAGVRARGAAPAGRWPGAAGGAAEPCVRRSVVRPSKRRRRMQGLVVAYVPAFACSITYLFFLPSIHRAGIQNAASYEIAVVIMGSYLAYLVRVRVSDLPACRRRPPALGALLCCTRWV